jgi:hypothetical protein
MKTYYYIALSERQSDFIEEKLEEMEITYHVDFRDVTECWGSCYTTEDPASLNLGFEEEFQSENKSYSPFEDSIGYHQSFGG